MKTENSGTNKVRKILVAVCGAGSCDQNTLDLARQTGKLLAQRGAVLICGGLGGIMTAAAQGAKEAGGTTIGLLPGNSPEDANPFIDFPLATGLGHARNAVITGSAGAIIAMTGGSGTLSEIGLGLKMGKAVIGLKAWSQIDGVKPAQTAPEAVDMAIAAILNR